MDFTQNKRLYKLYKIKSFKKCEEKNRLVGDWMDSGSDIQKKNESTQIDDSLANDTSKMNTSIASVLCVLWICVCYCMYVVCDVCTGV